MQIGILGVNYKSSELGLREVFARACVHLFGSESDMAAQCSIVLLSTCNRTEIYFSGTDLAELHSKLLNVLRQEISFAFEHKLYAYFGGECFAHLCRVTAGLDSAIVAETEIQRQVKTAYQSAACDHALTSEMHFLFQKCLTVGKKIRSSYLLPRGGPTLEKLIYDLCARMIGPSFSVFFIGNSEINRKMLAYLKLKKVDQMALCTRGLYSAQELQLPLVDWNHREEWQKFDVVICGSNCSHFAVEPAQLGKDLTCKIIFDLGMPRNVDPLLSRHPEMRLFNIEELGNMVAAKRFMHAQELCQAERLLREQMEIQTSLFQRRHVSKNRHALGI